MKVIAIRPLKGCHEAYLKNLTPDLSYIFYNNYTIDGDDFKIGPALPTNFFNQSTPSVNISAVVGKNGSGKSTAVELLLRAINNISFKQERVSADLIEIPGLRVEIFFQTNYVYKIRVFDKRITYYQYNQKEKKFLPIKDKFAPQNFFYTIAVNYSHYAYNSNDMIVEGDWLTGVFHKNDGYQTPLVLNPYRKKGVIDINSENELLKGRLIANLLRFPDQEKNHFKSLTTAFDAHSLKLSLKPNKEDAVLYELTDKENKLHDVTLKDIFDDQARNSFLLHVNGIFRFGYRSMSDQQKKKNKLALDYIVYKIISIAIKYYNFEEVIFIKDTKSFNSVTLGSYLRDLYRDQSHITLKLRQTLNYLRYKPQIIQTETPIKIEELAKFNHAILKRKNSALEGIELIPPPIYHTEIIICEKERPERQIPFSMLSSGEKQMIYSVHSLMYHLVNLDSVRRSSLKRTAYRYYNVILEEVELYAHPEMQRVFLNNILESFRELKLHDTAELNIMFVTHSPFILSDIPENNILFLESNGQPLPKESRMKTFGGNIHDLLANSFFLEKGTIGQFAFEKINKIIEAVRKDNRDVDNRSEDREVLALINLIGEPFLREKLLDMYYAKYDKQKRINQLEAELKTLRG